MFRNIKEKQNRIKELKGFEIFDQKVLIPDGMYEMCPKCKKTLDSNQLYLNFKVCMECGYHLRMHVALRAYLVFDEFYVFNHIMKTKNPLDFPDYVEKLEKLSEDLGVYNGVVTAQAKIENKSVIAILMDSDFMMGSMDSVVGEKITKAFEKATKLKGPVILFAASGGARMQEGIISLMQMAKTSGAVGKFQKAGGLYISILCDPTFGGTTASFASLGDIILAEPEALIGFAGPRVIKQTISQDLPEGFQSAEFLLEKGFIDKIVSRDKLKTTLSKLLTFHGVES